MNQNVFLFKPYEKFEQHTIVELDGTVAEQLKKSGDAVEISLGDYTKYREAAKLAADQFKKAEAAIKNSDNPIYNNPEVRDYELKKLRDEFEAATNEAESKYQEYRNKQIQEAEIKAARAYIPVTEKDRAIAEQAANRFVMQASQVYGIEAAYEVLAKLKTDLSKMTDSQKTAMQGKIADVVSVLDKKFDSIKWTDKSPRPKLNSIFSELQDVRNMDLLGVKAAKSLPNTVSTEYHTLRIVRGWK